MARGAGPDPLKEKPRLWRRQRLAGVAAEAALRLSGWSLAAAAVLCWSDRFWSPGHAARWAVWWAALAAGLAALWFWGARPWRRVGWEFVLGEAEKKFPQLRSRLRAAWELSSAPDDPATSGSLRQEHLERTRRLLLALPPSRLFLWAPSRSSRRALAAGLVGAAFLIWTRPAGSFTRVFAPWRDKPLEALVTVSPGDARVPWGRGAEIRASWAPGSLVNRAPQDLVLWVRDRGGWRAAPWDRFSAGRAEFQAENLTAPFQYKMSWRGLLTQSYAVTPVPFPAWRRLDAAIGGLNQDETIPLDGSVPLRFLTGSRVVLEGTPTEPLSSAEVVFSSPAAALPMRLRPDGRYAAAFELTGGVRFHFNLRAADGRRNASAPEYAIAAEADQPPSIQMLSPDAPVSADVGAEIPISYAVRDDGGVARVALLVRGKNGKPAEKTIRKFSPPAKNNIGDYDWSLRGFSPGRLAFRLAAYDNAEPPHSAATPWQAVDIADWGALRRAEKEWWGKSQARLDALAEQENRYLKQLEEKGRAQNEAALSSQEAALERAWSASSESLEKLSSALSRDPTANAGLSRSVADFGRAAARAAARNIPQADRARRAGDFPQAQDIHQRLAGLAAQGKNLLAAGSRSQDWRTAAARAQDLNLSAASFLGDLARRKTGAGLGAPERGALEEKLGRIERQLAGLARQIQRLARTAPPAPGVPSEDIPLQPALDAARSLESALAAGDARSAERLADLLSRDLSRISRALQGASSGALSAAEQAATEQARAVSNLWSKVADEERRARADAQKLDSRRTERDIRRQKNILAALEREQAALISEASAAKVFPGAALEQMKSVESQFAARQVSDAGERLRKIIGALHGLASSSGQEPEKKIDAFIAAGEAGVLKRLRQAQEETAARPDAESAGQAARQGRILAQTAGLEQSLRGLREDGFELPPAALSDVSGAAGQEEAARQALSAGDVRQAIFHQDKALKLLDSGKSALSSAMGSGRRVFSLELSPAGGMGGGGILGAGTGLVPLPSARDYLPPGVLRGELEESMGEKKPAALAPVIREYFQRIAQ
ncbi:MAG: hypothetical protein KGL04_00880 [Elusimicrobia bacterium]|nr:hypothetical protein [Elusimicrobiota bacterium]